MFLKENQQIQKNSGIESMNNLQSSRYERKFTIEELQFATENYLTAYLT